MAVLAEVDVQSKQTTGRYIVIKISKEKADGNSPIPRCQLSSKLEIIEEAQSESINTNRQSSDLDHAWIHNDFRPQYHAEELSLFSSLMQPSEEVQQTCSIKNEEKTMTKISMIIDWNSLSEGENCEKSQIQKKLLDNFCRNF